MPKPPTFPTLFNDVLKVELSKLISWRMLQPDKVCSATYVWSRNGGEAGSIAIMVNMATESPYCVLDYAFRGEPIKTKVPLISVPSNLGKGAVWYFLCPYTGMRCRKLYSIGKYFLHRKAATGFMYESQTRSKKMRAIESIYGSYFDYEKNWEQLTKKYFKSHYAGKPTKKYLNLKAKLEQGDSFTPERINSLFLL